MENTALILIAITLVFLVIIVSLLTVLVYRLIKNTPSVTTTTINTPDGSAPHPDISRAEFHPGIMDRLKDLESLKPSRSELICPNHRDEPGEVTCGICDKLFCKACIKPFKTMHFCKEHMPLVMRHDWEEIVTVKTSTQNPEEGVELFEKKKRIFTEKNLPTYIETHYKINIDQDYIETYLVVFAIKEEAEAIRSYLL